MTPEEKRAYNREYYQKYRKKGMKKGRKKGSSKTKTKTQSRSIVGLGTAGLNEVGKMQWALKKKEMQDEMNAALKGVTDPAERTKIIQEFQNKALAELQKMKADSSMATPKKEKTAKEKSSGSSRTPKAAKEPRSTSSRSSSSSSSRSPSGSSSSSRSSGGLRGGGSSIKLSGGAGKMSTADQNKFTGGGSAAAQTPTVTATEGPEMVQQVQNQIDDLQQRFDSGELKNLPEEQKEQVREQIRNSIASLKKELRRRQAG